MNNKNIMTCHKVITTLKIRNRKNRREEKVRKANKAPKYITYTTVSWGWITIYSNITKETIQSSLAKAFSITCFIQRTSVMKIKPPSFKMLLLFWCSGLHRDLKEFTIGLSCSFVDGTMAVATHTLFHYFPRSFYQSGIIMKIINTIKIIEVINNNWVCLVQVRVGMDRGKIIYKRRKEKKKKVRGTFRKCIFKIIFWQKITYFCLI